MKEEPCDDSISLLPLSFGLAFVIVLMDVSGAFTCDG